MVREEDAENILSSGPSFTYGGRYNKAGEFGALYLSENPMICEKEKLRQAGDQAKFLPLQVVGTIEVDIHDVLDLTDEDNIKTLGVHARDFVDLMDMTLPQSIAETARKIGFKALLVPSAVTQGKNLVIFEESLSQSQGKIKVAKIQKWPYL